MQRIALTALLSVALLGMPGLAQEPESTDVTPIVNSGNNLAFKLLVRLSRTGNENVFVSPTSIAMCLTMAYNGAAGTTLGAMIQTLGYDGLDPEYVNRANSFLRKELTGADPKVRLDIANSLWAHKTVGLQERFVSLNQNYFNARLSVIDFASPTAVPAINNWVSQNTNGRITQIVNKLDPADRLLLINAIYFKGKWTEPFDPKKTAPRDFYLTKTKTVKRQMMRREGSFNYLQDNGFQAVSLPYGDGRLAMYIFLPDSRDGIIDLLAQMSKENWDEWMGQFRRREGEVVLPRFRIEYDTSLVEPLSLFGMSVAFDPKEANFSYMVKPPENLFIGDVIHKTFVEVNEEGTEAAAVTGVKMMATAVPTKTDKFTFICDHPFVCAIRDNVTGAILFIGTIADPKQ